MALNPAQRLSEANNVKSDQNAKDIEKAIEAYTIDNNGNLPSGFSSLSSYGLMMYANRGKAVIV